MKRPFNPVARKSKEEVMNDILSETFFKIIAQYWKKPWRELIFNHNNNGNENNKGKNEFLRRNLNKETLKIK